MTNKAANDELKYFIHKKIKGIVKDPKTAEMLCPDQVVTCKVGSLRLEGLLCPTIRTD
jgi:hypothetical protein